MPKTEKKGRDRSTLVSSQAWVGDDRSVAARLMQIDDGSIEEERSRWRGIRMAIFARPMGTRPDPIKNRVKFGFF